LSVLHAGEHEAGTVDLDAAAVEPAGGGIGADEQEQVAGSRPVSSSGASRLRQRTRASEASSPPSRP
jgi:hypothetical protein